MNDVLFGRLKAALDWLAELWVPAFLFLLIACSLNHDPRAVSDMTYIVILVFVLGGIPLGLRRGGRVDSARFSVIPLIFMAIWVYGVILGLGNGLSPNVVFRNFAAMSLFFIYYVLVLLSPSLRQIQLGLYAGSAAFAIAVLWLVLTSETKGTFAATGFLALRYHYFLGTVIAAAAMMMLTVKSFVTGPFRILPVLAGALIFVAFFLSGARAFYLALVVSFASLAFAFAFSGWKPTLRVALLGMGFGALGAIITLIMASTAGDAAPVLTQAIQGEAEGGVRLDQFGALLAELSFFGKGLGAPLESGFSRDALGYGFELSYLSLGHKLGLFGLGIFLVTAAFQYLRTIRTLIRSEYAPAMVSALVMLGYLVSSYGNPTLFAPIFVSFFCVSLYIERTTARDLAPN